MRRSIIVVAAALAALILLSPAWAAEGWTWPVRGSVVTHVCERQRAALCRRDASRDRHRGGRRHGGGRGAGGTVTYAGRSGRREMWWRFAMAATRRATCISARCRCRAVSGWRSGTRVGEVGTTGRRSVSEPHLHFGVRLAAVENHYVDPLSLLPGIGVVQRVAPVSRRAPCAQERSRLRWSGRTSGTRSVRHPVAAPSAPRLPVAAPDRGRPLVLGGARAPGAGAVRRRVDTRERDRQRRAVIVMRALRARAVRPHTSSRPLTSTWVSRAPHLLPRAAAGLRRRGPRRACRASPARPRSRARP